MGQKRLTIGRKAVADVEYKPNADRLVIVLDASFEAPRSPDAARSTPED